MLTKLVMEFGLNNMLNLSDTTFIIPVRIENSDREFNFKYVIRFLCDHFKTNIIISESDKESKCQQLVVQIDHRETKITHLFEQNNSEIFHRTRLLNEMLAKVETPVTVNYDIDVFLKPQQYVNARNTVLTGFDLVYPYTKGGDQVRVDVFDKIDFVGIPLFDQVKHSGWTSLCGHCQFFNTQSYINGFMENEEFVSYGAEDRERMERFEKLGYKVTWINGKVYHIEHSRGVNSSPGNPHFKKNEELYYKLKNLNKDQLIDYYNNVEYLKKYGNTCNIR